MHSFPKVLDAIYEFLLPVAKPHPGLSVPPQTPDKHKFSPVWVVLFLTLYIVLIFSAAVAFQNWLNVVFFPLVLSTTVLGYHFYKRWLKSGLIDSERVRIADLVRSYANGFWAATVLALFFEAVYAFLLLLIFVGAKHAKVFDALANDDFSKHRKSPEIHVFALFFSLLGTGLIEEWVKYLVIQHCYRLYLDHPIRLTRQDIDSYVWIGAVVGLGLGTMESVVFTCVRSDREPLRQLVTALLSIFVHIPFQTTLGLIWSALLAKNDIVLRRVEHSDETAIGHFGEAKRSCSKTWSLGWRQFVMHGIYDFLKLELFIIAGAGLGYLALSAVTGLVVLCVAVFWCHRLWTDLMQAKELVFDAEDDNRL